MTITEEQLAEIEVVLAEATPGPWADHSNEGWAYIEPHDMVVIIALRNHGAALIAGCREAARLRYELTLLKVRAEHAEANFLEIVLSQKGGETK